MAQSVRVGSGTVALDTTPVPLATGKASIREVLVQASKTNTTNVLVGGSVNQYLQLAAGQAISVPISNLQAIYVAMESGTGSVNWFARD